MALLQNWLPPSRENWELLTRTFQLFPVVASVQWLTNWYPQGKTSTNSRLNLPGRWAWMAMELPGVLAVNYCMWTLPKENGLAGKLPWANWTMAGMFTIHYIYRAIINPLLNPSMSPIHAFVFCAAGSWQTINGLCIGGWLAAYGPTTAHDWAGRTPYMMLGMILWAWGLMGNAFHDDDLREIRRAATRRTEKLRKEGESGDGGDAAKRAAAADPDMLVVPREDGGIEKVYMLPKNGLFHWVLYAHYLCEWIEWAGFWMVGGWGCAPARNFFVNEIATMLPRAVQGKRWYIEKFGEEKVGGRWAVIPGVF